MEYAMVIVIVAVITLAIFVLLGPAILDWYQKILAAF
jgi:Flp pilus assembly pilin Flp